MLRRKKTPAVNVEKKGENLQLGALIDPHIKTLKEIQDDRDIILTIKLAYPNNIANEISTLWSELLNGGIKEDLYLISNNQRFKIRHHEINTRVVSYANKKSVESHVLLDWRVSVIN